MIILNKLKKLMNELIKN